MTDDGRVGASGRRSSMNHQQSETINPQSSILNQKSEIINPQGSLLPLGLSPFLEARMHVRPALSHALLVIVRNSSECQVMKLDQRSAVFFAQPVLQVRDDRIRHE